MGSIAVLGTVKPKIPAPLPYVVIVNLEEAGMSYIYGDFPTREEAAGWAEIEFGGMHGYTIGIGQPQYLKVR